MTDEIFSFVYHYPGAAVAIIFVFLCGLWILMKKIIYEVICCPCTATKYMLLPRATEV